MKQGSELRGQISSQRAGLIAFGELRLGDAPVGADRGIVPRHTKLVGRVVILVHHVRHHHIAQGSEAVCNAGRNVDALVPERAIGLVAEIEYERCAIGWRTDS